MMTSWTSQLLSYAVYLKYAERKCDFLFRTRLSLTILAGWAVTMFICALLYAQSAGLAKELRNYTSQLEASQNVTLLMAQRISELESFQVEQLKNVAQHMTQRIKELEQANRATNDLSNRVSQVEKLVPSLRRIAEQLGPTILPFGQEDLTVLDNSWVVENLAPWAQMLPRVIDRIYQYERNRNVVVVRTMTSSPCGQYGAPSLEDSLMLYAWNGIDFKNRSRLTMGGPPDSYSGCRPVLLAKADHSLGHEREQWAIQWSKRLYDRVYAVAQKALDVSMVDQFKQFTSSSGTEQPWVLPMSYFFAYPSPLANTNEFMTLYQLLRGLRHL
eukprot:GILJ01008950.1.p1 GENE.GILJ01008950.1~~GILJ01008950.1.p1  ORF type:complete len:329 (-),score=19.92 GILJ01008950.1:101-1087(-)